MSNLQLEPHNNIAFDDTPDLIFPTEIFFKIFISLDSGDSVSFNEAINNCRLVCKYFNEICFPLSVRYVELGYTHPSAFVMGRDRVISILQDHPLLAAHICHVSFDCAMYDLLIQSARVKPGALIPSWIEESTLLALPAVRSLSISVSVHGLRPYENIATGCRLLLEAYLWAGKLTSLILYGIQGLPLHEIMAFPTLTDISLDNCSVKGRGWTPSPDTLQSHLLQFSASNTILPMYPLALMANIEKITLVDVIWVSDAPTYAGPSLIFSQLTELVLDYIGALAGTSHFHGVGMKDTKFFPALKVLSLRFQGGDFLGTHRKAFRHLDSLETLTLRKFGEHGSEGDYDLTECIGPSRHCLLKLHVQWSFFDEWTSYPLKGLCDTLYSFRHENRLKSLHLRTAYPLAGATELANLFRPLTTEWTRLSEILTEQEAFPCLQSVTIEIDISLSARSYEAIGRGRDEGWLQEHVRAALDPSFHDMVVSSNTDFEFKVDFGLTT